jgi:hypothetical protein
LSDKRWQADLDELVERAGAAIGVEPKPGAESSASPPQSRRRRRLLAAVAVAAILIGVGAFALLGSGGGSDGGDANDESNDTSTSVTTDDAPEESDSTATPAGDFRDLVLDPGGAGDLRIGMTEAEAAAVTGEQLDFGDPETMPAGGECVYIPGVERLAVVSVDGETIAAIMTGGAPDSDSASSPQGQTVEGVGVGSSPAEVDAAYPGEVEMVPSPNQAGYDWLVVDAGDGNAYVFDTGGESELITFVTVGRRDVVLGPASLECL